MTTNRALASALALATVAALALSACRAKSSPAAATRPPTSAPRSTPPRSAADRLASAIRALYFNGVGYDFTVTEGVSTQPDYLAGSGSYDPFTNAATVDIKGHVSGYPAEYDFVQIGGGVQTDQEVWAKINVGPLNATYDIPRTKWMSLDPGKITEIDALPLDLSGDFDVLDMARLMTSVSDVQSTSATSITGTVDVTQSDGVSGINSDEYSTAGAKASALPFVAALDGQGRLISLVLDTQSFDKDLYRKFTFTDFGSPRAIKPPPPSGVVPATAKNYEYFNA